MLMGIGTDILRIEDIRAEYLDLSDSFMKKTYTEKELEEAACRESVRDYYATRFAGKEAVFKALNRESRGFRMNEVEILSRSSGQPYVVLHGNTGKEARLAGIRRVLISLSYDRDYAIAYAAAVSDETVTEGEKSDEHGIDAAVRGGSAAESEENCISRNRK